MRAGVRSSRARDAYRDRTWARTGTGLLVPQSRWNSADKSTSMTLSNNDLTVTKSAVGDQWHTVRATVPIYGRKVQFDVSNAGGTHLIVGLSEAHDLLDGGNFIGITERSCGYYTTGQTLSGNVAVSYGAAYGSGDVITVKFDGSDPRNGSVEFKKNGASQGIAYTGLKGMKYPAVSIFQGGSVKTATLHARKADLIYPLDAGYETPAGD